MPDMDCPKCGAHNETDVGSCLSCGASLPEQGSATTLVAKSSPKPASRLQASGAPPKQCPHCMTLNAATFKFCARCGTPLGATGAPDAGKSAPAAEAKPGAAASKPPAAAARTPAASAGTKPVADPSAKPATAPAGVAAKPAAAAPGAARPIQAPPAATKPPPARPAPPPPPKPGPGSKPAPAAGAAAKPAPPRARARISAIARDGSRSADYVLTQSETRVGRAVADEEVKLDKDAFVAPAHAVFKFEGEQLTVQDGGSGNGVFLWFKERELQAGDELRIGRQRLRIEWLPEEPETLADQPLWGSPDPGYVARAVQLLEGGGEGDVFPLKQGENLVGRGTGDVSFPQDGYVSSRHCMVTVNDGQIGVKDLGSANGTFVKIAGSAPVSNGDLLLVGEQILRVDPA